MSFIPPAPTPTQVELRARAGIIIRAVKERILRGVLENRYKGGVILGINESSHAEQALSIFIMSDRVSVPEMVVFQECRDKVEHLKRFIEYSDSVGTTLEDGSWMARLGAVFDRDLEGRNLVKMGFVQGQGKGKGKEEEEEEEKVVDPYMTGLDDEEL